MPSLRRTVIVAASGASVRVERRELGRRPDAEPVPTAALTLRAKLDELSSRVRRLTVDRRDPEKFHMDKSQIAAELQRLADAVPA